MTLSLFGTNSTYSAFFFLHAYYYTKQSEITLNHHFLYPNWFLCQFRGLFRSHSIAVKGQLLRHCESHHLVFHIFLSILSSASDRSQLLKKRQNHTRFLCLRGKCLGRASLRTFLCLKFKYYAVFKSKATYVSKLGLLFLWSSSASFLFWLGLSSIGL